MKNKSKIFIIIFALCLVLPTMLYPVSALISTGLSENRKKEPFPAFGLNFGREFEKFYQDHLPFRDPLIMLYGKIMEGLGVKSLGNETVFAGQEDWLFYRGESSEADYCGTNIMTEDEMAAYLHRLQYVSDYYTAKNKKFVYYVLPNKENAYSEYMPTYVKVQNQKKRLDVFVEYIRKNSNINVVYPKDAMEKNKADFQLYYKYDTHWNEAGAFVGAQEIFKTLGLPQYSLNAVKTEKKFRNTGDLANMLRITKVIDTTYAFSNYYDDVTVISSDNSPFGYNGIGVEHFVNSSANKQKVAVFGDSFGAAMLHTLNKNFSDVSRIINIAGIGNVLPILEEADVVIIQAVERYSLNIFSGLYDLLKKAN